MTAPEDHDPIAEKLLAGTPTRVLSGLVGLAPEACALIDADAEALAALALTLDPVRPSKGLRDRIAADLAAAPTPTRRAALVVLDMQRDHLTEGRPLEVPRARAIVPALRRRIDETRARGESVVYVVDHHEPGDPELDVWPAHNTGAPADDVWPELAPAPQDPVVTHRSYSGFFESRLHDVLRGLDVNTVVLTGCITEIHLFATATDALQRGYRVEVPRDCQAGSSPEAEHLVLATLSVMPPTMPVGA